MQTPIKPSKTVIITGGNSGLGYFCAQAIAQSQQDWHIIIASRNLPRVEEAVQQLTAETIAAASYLLVVIPTIQKQILECLTQTIRMRTP